MLPDLPLLINRNMLGVFPQAPFTELESWKKDQKRREGEETMRRRYST